MIEAIRLLLEKSKRDRQILAIDGRCGAGKTTLAHRLMEEVTASGQRVFVAHTDDYTLPFDRRTESVAGHMDFLRLKEELLLPFLETPFFLSRPFDPHKNRFLREEKIPSPHLLILEGAYSTHPILRPFLSCSIFLDIASDKQQARLLARNPDRFDVFCSRWIPAEEAYIKETDPISFCDLYSK
ncbi:MAG: hypothetical protein IJC85_06865 [Oscillospiraceae bacterium]|nr:hypothetical protein [Oscillospiraceae bacterium]